MSHNSGGLKSKIGGGGGWQGWLLLRTVREGSVPGFSPWFVDDRLHVYMACSPIREATSKFPLFVKTSAILD